MFANHIWINTSDWLERLHAIVGTEWVASAQGFMRYVVWGLWMIFRQHSEELISNDRGATHTHKPL